MAEPISSLRQQLTTAKHSLSESESNLNMLTTAFERVQAAHASEKHAVAALTADLKSTQARLAAAEQQLHDVAGRLQSTGEELRVTKAKLSSTEAAASQLKPAQGKLVSLSGIYGCLHVTILRKFLVFLSFMPDVVYDYSDRHNSRRVLCGFSRRWAP